MKSIKITLTIIVLTTIIVASIRGCLPGMVTPPPPKSPTKQNRAKIEKKIDSLKDMPESSFSDSLHREIKYYIREDYKDNKLGSTHSANEQWKKNLSNRLYAAYSERFINQAFYVFKGSEWEFKKLEIIRKEYQDLQNEGYESGMLGKNSNRDKQLNEIKSILAKYDNVTAFINSCKGFSFLDVDLNVKFPITTVEQKINLSKEHLTNNLENNYVNNCKRIRTSLSEVPQILFKAHVKYLDNKINYWNGRYIIYSNHRDYSKGLFLPLKTEIDKLYNDIYKGVIIEPEYHRLDSKLTYESKIAYNYFEKKN